MDLSRIRMNGITYPVDIYTIINVNLPYITKLPEIKSCYLYTGTNRRKLTTPSSSFYLTLEPEGCYSVLHVSS